VFKAPKSCIDLAQQVLAKSDTVERVITMMDHSPRQSVAPIFDWLMGCDVQRRYDRFDLMLTGFANLAEAAATWLPVLWPVHRKSRCLG